MPSALKKNTMMYSFSFVLLVEILTATVLRDSISSPCNPYWYILLTQAVLAVIFLNINYNKILLRLCQRQVIITQTLLTYYLLGIISLVFSISDNLYMDMSKYLLLSFAFLVLLQTFFKSKK